MLKNHARLVWWAASWLVVSLVLFLVALPGLPDTIAIHWDASGNADGAAPAWLVPLAAAVIILLGLSLAPVFSVSREPSMEAFALVGMSGGLATAVALIATSVNAGVAEWREAPEIGTLAIVALFGLPTIALIAGILLGRHWYPIKSIPRGFKEVIDIEPGERVSWVGRGRVKGVPLVVFGLAVLLLFAIPGLPLWVFVLVAGVGVVFAQVEAHVTNDGIRVRLGGIPVRKLPLATISSARAIDVDPEEYGGRGWRQLPDVTALILRPGEALAVTLNEGARFVITVDDPATGAALLNGLLEEEGT